MTDKRIVFITVPDQATGEKIADALVREKLAACVSIIPGIISIYVWQGKLEKSGENLLIAKTRADTFDALRKRVVELHPYECPEIVSTPIDGGLDKYLTWIEESVRK